VIYVYVKIEIRFFETVLFLSSTYKYCNIHCIHEAGSARCIGLSNDVKRRRLSTTL